MEIKYSENAKLIIEVTPKMLQDFKECKELAMVPYGSGKDCGTCSMNVIVNSDDDTSICQLDGVWESMIEMIVELDGECNLCRPERSSQ